jgi:hypothetical protein
MGGRVGELDLERKPPGENLRVACPPTRTYAIASAEIKLPCRRDTFLSPDLPLLETLLLTAFTDHAPPTLIALRLFELRVW